jgi:hypothetical protein
LKSKHSVPNNLLYHSTLAPNFILVPNITDRYISIQPIHEKVMKLSAILIGVFATLAAAQSTVVCTPGRYSCSGSDWYVCNTSRQNVFAGTCGTALTCRINSGTVSCVPPAGSRVARATMAPGAKPPSVRPVEARVTAAPRAEERAAPRVEEREAQPFTA